MHVGVFPRYTLQHFPQISLPHARGGVSLIVSNSALRRLSSPCTWGCFQPKRFLTLDLFVFPMHVGVFREHQEM